MATKMNKPNQTQVIQNLRNLWETKKVTENMTQTEAASQLGWTQSAFSHYLTEITTLNSAAIIKLANFLEVCPSEIDPNFSTDMPTYTNFASYPETLSGKKSLVSKNRFINVGSSNLLSVIEVDQKNQFFPLGSKVGVVSTQLLQKNWVETRTANTKAICLTKKSKTSKFSIVSIERAKLKSLPLDKFTSHLTVIYSKLF